MAVPTFVTAGTFGTFSSVATVTPALPASRTTGNILIAFVNGATSGGKTFSVGGGWTIGDQQSATGAQSSCWAWILVTGTEAAPVFTWTGNMTGSAQVFQYSGNLLVTPFGITNKAAANASTTLTIASITTSTQNSLIIALMLTGAGQTIPIPTGYTSRSASASGGGERFCDGQKFAAGATQAISVPVTSTVWNSYGIELIGSGSGTSDERASQVVQSNLESYSDPVFVRSSQVVVSVLRTVAVQTGHVRFNMPMQGR